MIGVPDATSQRRDYNPDDRKPRAFNLSKTKCSRPDAAGGAANSGMIAADCTLPPPTLRPAASRSRFLEFADRGGGVSPCDLETIMCRVEEVGYYCARGRS